MGMAAVSASFISSVNLRSRSSRDRLLSASLADNSCSLSANCFQFALAVSHLGCPRLSGTFVKASGSTITVAMWSEASFLTKKLNIAGKRVTIAIWDTAGQERFHALGPIYYRDSNGAILVYDITDEDSFQKVKNWVKELRKMLGNEISLCIVGNKIDLEKDRHVSVEEAESYTTSVGAKHFHTSAKTNKGIEDMFLELCKRMIEKAEENGQKSGMVRSPSARRNIVTIVDDEPQPKKGCCG
ncbi:hypothetical protein LSH36_347g04025 [Paralvinella palmiformis]|uniref:Ras-related protein Rab-21 n=1 Tax=Paralvinella palmiformis TaxID=53620 RepID=A0AAD9N2J7_9ANNE|nr:hypothetical protein LSH36_347g04025 [Paralvinella palmiformis]